MRGRQSVNAMSYHDFASMTQDEFNTLHRKFVRRFPSLEDFFDAAVENTLRYPIPAHLDLVGTLGHIARQKRHYAQHNHRRINPYSGTLMYFDDILSGENNGENPMLSADMFGYLPRELDSEESDFLERANIQKLSPKPDWYRYAERECRNNAHGKVAPAAWQRRLKLLELYLELVNEDLYELSGDKKFNLFYDFFCARGERIAKRTLSDDLTHVRRVCEYWIAYCRSTLPSKHAAP